MKKTTITSLTAYLAIIVGTLLPGNATATSINVEFDDPEHFSDFEEDGFYNPKLLKSFENEMLDALMDEALEYLPKGGELEITFHDIDLAGEYEPWRQDMQYVRILREIYPPRLKFEYRVSDADNQIITQGRAQLTNLIYLWNLPRTLWNNDTFEHEKRILKDWASNDLPELISNG